MDTNNKEERSGFDRILADLDFSSEQLSTNTRTIALSLLAVSWALLVGTDKAAFSLSPQLRLDLVRVGVFVIVALAVDFLQYVAGFLNSHLMLKKALREKRNVTYDRRAILYQLRWGFFWLKLVGVPAIVVYFVWLLAPLVLTSSSYSH